MKQLADRKRYVKPVTSSVLLVIGSSSGVLILHLFSLELAVQTTLPRFLRQWRRFPEQGGSSIFRLSLHYFRSQELGHVL